MIRAAEAYKAQREIRAKGDAAKFLSGVGRIHQSP